MNYGLEIRNFSGNKNKVLTKAGYRQVPNHSFSRVQVDQQWINNTNGFRNYFPRFHIIKDKKRYFIHCDMTKEDHSKITTSNLAYEIQRIKKINKYDKNNTLEISTKV